MRTEYRTTIYVKDDEEKQRRSYQRMSDALRDMAGRSEMLALELWYGNEPGRLARVKVVSGNDDYNKRADQLVSFIAKYIGRSAIDNIERRTA